MSTIYKASRGALWLLILAGLWGALRVSYSTATGTAPCPDLVIIPACYPVSLGYLCMLAAEVPPPVKLSRALFFTGWALVFLIAVTGTGFEITVGETCPSSNSGVPLCYFSLGFCVAIFLLYRLRNYAGGLAT